MKKYSEFVLAGLLIAMLAAVQYWMGPRASVLAAFFSMLWFLIAIVLLTRPPGIPEFVSDPMAGDEQHVVRRDVIPKLPWIDRVRLALGVACGSCLAILMTLLIFAM